MLGSRNSQQEDKLNIKQYPKKQKQYLNAPIANLRSHPGNKPGSFRLIPAMRGKKLRFPGNGGQKI